MKKIDLSSLLGNRMKLSHKDNDSSKTQSTIDTIIHGGTAEPVAHQAEPIVPQAQPQEPTQKIGIVNRSRAKHINQAMNDFLLRKDTLNFSKDHLLVNTDHYRHIRQKFFSYEDEQELEKEILKIIKKDNYTSQTEPNIDSITHLLLPIYRNTNGDRDYSSDFFPVDFSIGTQVFSANINRYTGFIKGSTITVDSLYRALKLLEDETFDIEDLSICVNSKKRDDISRKSVLLGVASKITENDFSPQSKSAYFANLKQLAASTDKIKLDHIDLAKKYDEIKPYEITEESHNPLEDRTCNLVLSIVSGASNTPITAQDESLLNLLLDPKYCSRNPNNEVRFSFNNTSYQVFPNQHTGYLNDGLLKVETLYQILKILSSQIHIDMNDLKLCVNQKRSDDFVKGRILSRVRSSIYESYNLTEEQKQEFLTNLKSTESWIDVNKVSELEKAHKNNKLAKNLGETAEETEIDNIKLAKRVFQIQNKESLAIEDSNIRRICIEQISSDKRLSGSIDDNLVQTFDYELAEEFAEKIAAKRSSLNKINEELHSVTSGIAFSECQKNKTPEDR